MPVLALAAVGATMGAAAAGAFTPDAPPPRNIGQETRDTLQAEVDLAPQQYAAQAQYAPLYGALNRITTAQSLYGTPGAPGLIDLLRQATPDLSSIQAAAQTAQRKADVADVERLGPEATAAFRAANPEQAALMAELNKQALEGIQAGAAMDPGLFRQVQQFTRQGQAARGFGFGPTDVGQEVFNTGSTALALRQQNRNFAGQVVGWNQATATDPWLAILGRPSQAPAQSQALAGQGAALGQGGPTLFDPFNSYAADLYNTNYNAAAASNIAGANNMAGVFGSGIGALGKVVSAKPAGASWKWWIGG